MIYVDTVVKEALVYLSAPFWLISPSLSVKSYFPFSFY